MLRNLRPRINHATAVAYLALFVALGGGALAATSFVGSDGKVQACVTKKGKLTVVKAGKKCPKGQTQIAWNQKGPVGQNGGQGSKGDNGDKGDKGDTGPSTGPAGGDLIGTYPDPTIGSGKVTASAIAAGAVTLDKLTAIPAVRAVAPSEAPATDQVLNTGDVPEPLQFEVEAYDVGSMHETGNFDETDSEFTVPRTGVYGVSAGLIFSDPGSNYGTKRQLYITRDPDTSIGGDESYIAGEIGPPANPGVTAMNASGVVQLNQGDVVQAWVSHNATANLAVALGGNADGRNFLSMTWLGPVPS